jgi:branched-chain amino acid transport system permease protein
MLGSIYAMVGVALTLSIGVLRFLNFSIPGLFMLGGMATWWFIHHGVPWPLAAAGALAVGAAAAMVVERFTGAGCAARRSSCRWSARWRS